MLNIIIDLVNVVNIIDHLDLLLFVLRHEGAHIFYVEHGSKSGQEVEDTIKDYGIKIGGRHVAAGYIWFAVGKRQARWAEYLMMIDGVALLGSCVDRRNIQWAARRQGRMPRKWKDKKGTARKNKGALEKIVENLLV